MKLLILRVSQFVVHQFDEEFRNRILSETLGLHLFQHIKPITGTDFFVLKIGFTCCFGIPDRKSVSNFSRCFLFCKTCQKLHFLETILWNLFHRIIFVLYTYCT